LAALALAVPVCLGQRYSFSEATEGLGNLNVICIAQDRSGYLWVGTENGLYRYDGSQFLRFGVAEGLHGHSIHSLFAAPDGTLFVGTTTGIFFELRDGNFSEINSPDPANPFSQRIGTVFTAIAPDRVVTADGSGVFLLRHLGPDKWAAEPMHLEGGSIWSVQTGPGGVLWYGCDSDLCRLAGGKTTHMGAAFHLPADRWLRLLVTPDGHLWVRGASHLGEVLPDENRYEPRDLPGQSSAMPYVPLAEDAQGHIAASRGAAFGLWEAGHWRMVTTRNGLPRFDLSALFVDREGSVWIGVAGHGLSHWVGQDRWEAYTAADGLSNDIVWTSLRDRSGRLWVGTESGLDYIPAGGTSARSWTGVQTTRAASLAESADGGIWLGSAAGSLVRIDPKTLAGRAWKMPEVYRILSDGEHRLWVATNVGLYVVDTAARNHTPRLVADAAFPHPGKRFRGLSLDSANRLWAASDEGLFRLDGNGWKRIDPGLPGVIPSLIAADRQGNLWASGAFPGVMRLRIAGDRVVESEHIVSPRLLSEQVVSLAVDHRGWIWVGQDAGLTVYDGRSWRSFTHDDGLIWNDIDSNGLAEDTDGSLWIGTSGGLSHLLKPQAVLAITPLAPVFSQIAFGSNAIVNGAHIPWSAGALAISIAPLSLRDAHHIRIRYRLLGLETEWMETGNTSIRYPHLEPGTYRFQSVMTDGTGGAASPMEEISFRITSRWWQSGALRLGLVLLACFGVVLAWRWSIHLLMRQKQQLELAVRQRTETLNREKAELLHAHEQMRQLAEHDDLTGVWNHRIIVERLRGEVDRSLRDGMPLSVILVDLDHFKHINDTFGHPSGDLVLKEIGALLLRSVRSYDWVGRYGGEEFLLVLQGSSFVSARIRAEQLRMAVQAARVVDDKTAIQVTASFGVASGLPSDYETLIQAADTALYEAKNHGRNCVIATEIDSPPSSASPQN
jgi:diguanylate cyclase (GGDEF)-like protein